MGRWAGWLLLSLLVAGAAACGRNDRAEPRPTPPPRPAWTTVRVTGEVGLTGRGDAGGVQVYIPDSPFMSITGPKGRYTLRGIEPGDYAVLARADGFETHLIGNISVPDPPTTSTVVLAKAVLKPRMADHASTATAQVPGAIEGVVTYGAGPRVGSRPDLGACRVELGSTPYRTICGNDGRFMLWAIPAGRYTLRAEIRGYAVTSNTVEVLPGKTANVSIEIKPAAPPSGTRRISGFVEMRGIDGNLTQDYARVLVRVDGRSDKDATLDGKGAFTIAGLAPARYVLTATANGYGSSAPAEIDLTDIAAMSVQMRLSAAQTSATTTLEAGTASIVGRAIKNEPNVSDMSGITVAVPGTSVMATTDADGNFALGGVPAGSRSVIAQASGYKDARVGPFEVTAGQDLQLDTIQLEPSIELPRVISTDPQSGTRDVRIDREIPIMIRFNKKMDSESLRKAIWVEPAVSCKVFVGRELPTTDYDLACVILYGVSQTTPARFRAQYRINVNRDARDTEGNRMERPFAMTLRTGGPSIIGTIPANRGMKPTGSPADPVTIRFNAPIDPASFNNRTLRFTPRISPEPQYQLATEPDSGWSRLNVIATLDPNTTYRITLGQGVRTVNNLPLENTPYSFSFRTAGVHEFVPPAIPRRVK